MKSHVITCDYSLFLYKMQGQSHPMTQEKEILPSLEFVRPCAIHKNVLTKKSAVSPSLYVRGLANNLPCIMLHIHFT